MDKFTITEKGYSVKEVNDFIDNVIAQTESMLGKMKKQQRDVIFLQKQIESYQKLENELKSALVRAEHSKDDIIKQAQIEKDTIIEDAKKNASRIVNDALLRAEKVELKTETLERNMKIFKKKLKLVVEQQLAVIDEIEELELK
jgi:cell division initiation protein